jgi:Domain of unknown function (DUF3597)
MGIFDRIKSAIFGSATASEASGTGKAGVSTGKDASARPAAAGIAPTAAAAPASSSAAPMSQVDVEAVLTNLAAQKGQKLDWRKSIVDLMKLLDLDSSLTARKELAKELNYTGDISDSAAMNMWLHKQVMAKLAASGGKVPEDLRT